MAEEETHTFRVRENKFEKRGPNLPKEKSQMKKQGKEIMKKFFFKKKKNYRRKKADNKGISTAFPLPVGWRGKRGGGKI